MRLPLLTSKLERRCLNYKPAQQIRNFVSSTRGSGKYGEVWKKSAYYFGTCFSCIAGILLYDWLKNKRLEVKNYSFIAHAKTDIPKSKQFNFVADVVQMVAPGVVHIEGCGQGGRFMGHQFMMSSSSGSGFLVTEDGLVLTNAHVVQNMRNVTVTLADGSSVDGDIVSLDRASDLAAIQLRNPNKKKFRTIQLGDSSTIRPGEFVVAMGSPLRLSNTVTSGIVSTVHRAAGDLDRRLPQVEYIQTDAPINVGNSGGPLVNLDGEVIGINSMTVEGAVGISFAIPVNIVKKFLDSAVEKNLKNSLKPARGYIGIHMLTLTPGIIGSLQGRVPGFPKVDSGVLVPEVIPGSPSHRAGIYPGDIITSINGTEVTNSKQVYAFVAAGELLTLEILRGRKKLKIVVQPETVQ